MGGYPGLNRELTAPHTVALPIELYPPNKYYVGVIRTLNSKYQKFMTYPLVHKIFRLNTPKSELSFLRRSLKQKYPTYHPPPEGN